MCVCAARYCNYQKHIDICKNVPLAEAGYPAEVHLGARPGSGQSNGSGRVPFGAAGLLGSQGGSRRREGSRAVGAAGVKLGWGGVREFARSVLWSLWEGGKAESLHQHSGVIMMFPAR